MKKWPISLSVCSFRSCHAYKLCTVEVYIFLLSKKHPLPTVVCLNIWGECSVTRCCCFLVYMGFVLFCFCVVNWYLKNKKQQQKITTTTVYRLKNHCFLYYWDPKSRLSKAGVGFELLLWCGLRVLQCLHIMESVHKPRCAAIDFVYFHNFNCSKLHYILQSPSSICICLSFRLFQYKKGFNLSAGLLKLFLLFDVIYWCGKSALEN